MSNLSPLDEARAAIAAASRSADPDLVVIYTAAARTVANRIRKELDAFETLLVAREKELVRLAHRDAEQLPLGGRR